MSNPFFIQQGLLGAVRSAQSLTAFEDLPAAVRAEDGLERQFFGLTIPSRRFLLAAVIGTAALLALIGRAAYLQVARGDHYAALAEANRVRTYTVVPPRGIVSDRFGTPLIQNVSSFIFTMTFADLPRETAPRGETLSHAADLVGVPRTDLDLLLTAAARDPYEPFVVEKGIPYEAALRLAIAEPDLPGFHLQAATVRSYATAAPTLSHLLGYTGNISPEEYQELKDDGYRPVDEIGKTGIERAEEMRLRGTPGQVAVEVDARGRELSVDSKTDPTAGQNLTLTVDLPLQQFIEGRVADVLIKNGLSRASVVAIDPQNGAVRALVSFPTFDSNAFVDGIDAETYARLLEDPDRPLFPRAVGGEFPPGSTFKPFVAYTALSEGIVDDHTSFVSTGGLRIGEWWFPDWKAGGHGVTDVRKAIAESVNTYFYVVGGGYDNVTGLGVERITAGARQLGFGELTGIGLPGEADGFLPSKEWKEEAKGERWYVGDTYHLAIGQGDLLVTPLQLAVANAALANGGTRYLPHLVEKVDDEPVAAVAADVQLDRAAVQTVREGMRQAVTVGSARFLSGLARPVAGKTGTAQTPGNQPTHAWFEGFGPYDDPTLSIVILIENGGEGSSIAVPIARDIFEWWFANR